jgi:hypothetical protein
MPTAIRPGTWISRWSAEPTATPIATPSMPSGRKSSALTMIEAL